MSKRRLSSAIGPVLAAGLLLATSDARAGDSDAAMAQSLFDAGRALLDAGRYAEACPKLAESQRLDPGGGTLLNLALCHEREGKTGTAWLEYREALANAQRDRRDDRVAFASEHIAALEPKLIRLTVIVPPAEATDDLEVELDGSRMSRQAWGVILTIDPGEHRLTAKRGDASWSTTVRAVTPAHVYEVVVEKPQAPHGAVTSVVEERPSPPPRRSTAFWIALSSAGLLAATSAVTGLVALDANSYVEDHCSKERDYCWAADAAAARSRARTFAWISTGTLGGAVIAATVAFVLPLDRESNVSAGVVAQPDQAVALLRWRGF